MLFPTANDIRVFQEFVVSKDQIFIYHSIWLTWRELKPYLQAMCKLVRLPGGGQLQGYPITAADGRCLRQVEHFIRTDYLWVGAIDPRDVIRYCHNFIATDARDYFYAFWGLFPPYVTSRLTPSYLPSSRVNDILTDVVSILVEQHPASILGDAVLRVRPREAPLPSWIPYYFNPEYHGPRPPTFYHGPTRSNADRAAQRRGLEFDRKIVKARDLISGTAETTYPRPSVLERHVLVIYGIRLGVLGEPIRPTRKHSFLADYYNWMLFELLGERKGEILGSHTADVGDEVWAFPFGDERADCFLFRRRPGNNTHRILVGQAIIVKYKKRWFSEEMLEKLHVS